MKKIILIFIIFLFISGCRCKKEEKEEVAIDYNVSPEIGINKLYVGPEDLEAGVIIEKTNLIDMLIEINCYMMSINETNIRTAEGVDEIASKYGITKEEMIIEVLRYGEDEELRKELFYGMLAECKDLMLHS